MPHITVKIFDEVSGSTIAVDTITITSQGADAGGFTEQQPAPNDIEYRSNNDLADGNYTVSVQKNDYSDGNIEFPINGGSIGTITVNAQQAGVTFRVRPLQTGSSEIRLTLGWIKTIQIGSGNLQTVAEGNPFQALQVQVLHEDGTPAGPGEKVFFYVDSSDRTKSRDNSRDNRLRGQFQLDGASPLSFDTSPAIRRGIVVDTNANGIASITPVRKHGTDKAGCFRVLAHLVHQVSTNPVRYKEVTGSGITALNDAGGKRSLGGFINNQSPFQNAKVEFGLVLLKPRNTAYAQRVFFTQTANAVDNLFQVAIRSEALIDAFLDIFNGTINEIFAGINLFDNQSFLTKVTTIPGTSERLVTPRLGNGTPTGNAGEIECMLLGPDDIRAAGLNPDTNAGQASIYYNNRRRANIDQLPNRQRSTANLNNNDMPWINVDAFDAYIPQLTMSDINRAYLTAFCTAYVCAHEIAHSLGAVDWTHLFGSEVSQDDAYFQHRGIPTGGSGNHNILLKFSDIGTDNYRQEGTITVTGGNMVFQPGDPEYIMDPVFEAPRPNIVNIRKLAALYNDFAVNNRLYIQFRDFIRNYLRVVVN